MAKIEKGFGELKNPHEKLSKGMKETRVRQGT
jgi:hypothetical protein